MTKQWFTGMFVAGVLLVGCGEKRELREWQPTDHAQPEGADVDPSRVAQEQTAAETPEQIEARAAAALYRVSCASCHGNEGRGDGMARPPAVQIPSFADAAWQQSRTDEQLASAIREGKNLMPKFGDKVNPTGIQALVKHVRRLGTPAQ